jgi:hypothetical protein
MAIRIVNFVVMLVTYKAGLRRQRRSMTNEQFEREKNYRVSISIAKYMLSQKLITKEEYHRIDSMLIDKYLQYAKSSSIM